MARKANDQKINKANGQRPKGQKDNRDKTCNSRDGQTKPNSVRSKSSQSSSHSSHLRNKPKAKGGPNSKSSVVAPIRSNKKIVKPKYQWVQKRPKSTNSDSSVNSSCVSSDKQDMSRKSVSSVDSNGKPSVKMDWVPRTV